MTEEQKKVLDELRANDKHPERGAILKKFDGEGFYRDNR